MALEVLVLALVAAATYFLWLRLASPSYRYPPGPRSLPFLGNLLDVPTVKPWLGYTKMMEKYGKLKARRTLEKLTSLLHR